MEPLVELAGSAHRKRKSASESGRVQTDDRRPISQ